MCYESLEHTLQLCVKCQEPWHGSMVYIVSKPETDVDRWTNAWKAAGIPYEAVPQRQLFERVPGLASSEVRAAFQLPDRSIRTDVLLRYLAAEAEQVGVEIRNGTKAIRLIQVRDRVQGVATELGEEISGRLVILAGNAGGVSLIPRTTPELGERTSDWQFVNLKTHLLAMRPEVSPWPFCVVDADGLNHMPHVPMSVFGTSRWLEVENPRDHEPDPQEIERIWTHVKRLFPNLRREEREALHWAGTTVQAARPGVLHPERAPLPMVVDHERDTPPIRNLLSIFRGVLRSSRAWLSRRVGSCTTSFSRAPKESPRRRGPSPSQASAEGPARTVSSE